MMVAQRTKGVDSARRVLEILLQFSDSKPELTIDGLLETHDISLPSAYRYISLLREMHLIEEHSKGTFVLSPRMLQLARAAEATLDYKVEAQPVLDRLTERTGETSLYLRRIDDAAVCIAIAETDHAISISFSPGHMMPLHAGAAAKILLSDLSGAKRELYLSRLKPPIAKKTRTSLIMELEQIRLGGYAESQGEVDDGVWACASSVRARNTQIGAISVVAPAYRVGTEKRREIGDAVRVAAEELESVLVALS
jgi:DNA-binding IclR family transcriptional regulator